MLHVRFPLRSYWLIILIAFAISSCNLANEDGDGGDENGSPGSTVFIWVGSDKDSYVSCGQSGPPCPEESINYGDSNMLIVARTGVALKKSYVHFGLPILPEGSTVEEAYFEMYHPGKNEDGQTDDVSIPLARAASSWSPLEITFENEPNPQLTGEEYTINLNSQDWSGSPNIVDIVIDWYDNPSSNHGFYIYWDQLNPGIEKGFYSNNDVQRTADDLGKSPRLLLKVVLPNGQSSDAITLPAIPPDNDLAFDGQEIIMARFRVAESWPEDWNVTMGL